MAHDSMTQ
jgi:hypothetical protein